MKNTIILMSMMGMTGCISDKKSDPIVSAYIGTWKGQGELNGVQVIMQMTIGASKAFNISLSVIGEPDPVIVLTYVGTWVDLGNNLLELSYSQCAAHDGSNLQVIVCKRPVDALNVNIQGNVWIYTDENDQTINLVRQ